MRMVDMIEIAFEQIRKLLDKHSPTDEKLPEYSRIHTGYNLYGQVIEAEFMQIKLFQLAFPKELVIIDLNGDWEEMTDTSYKHIDMSLKLM